MGFVVSIRYNAGESLNDLCDHLDSVFQHESMRRTAQRNRRGRFLSEEDLIRAPDEIPVDDHRVLADMNVPALSRQKAKVLTRRVDFVEISYADSLGTLRARCQLSRKNDFPALGAQLWLDRELVLPAGFVHISAETTGAAEKARAMIAKINDR